METVPLAGHSCRRAGGKLTDDDGGIVCIFLRQLPSTTVVSRLVHPCSFLAQPSLHQAQAPNSAASERRPLHSRGKSNSLFTASADTVDVGTLLLLLPQRKPLRGHHAAVGPPVSDVCTVPALPTGISYAPAVPSSRAVVIRAPAPRSTSLGDRVKVGQSPSAV